MTKNEMIALLGSAGVTQEIITAMEQAYEMGFEQGAVAARGMETLVEAAAEVIRSFDGGGDPYTGRFWDAYNDLKGMV